MPVLGCGAEMAKLMDVSDQDVTTIEEVIAERLALGVSQAVAQRQAVDEALAQLAEERSAVMKAVMEQLAKTPDMFPEEFATKRTKGDTGIKTSSRGTETIKGANVNSEGQQITATKQGVDNFWRWFGDSAAKDKKGRPLVLYHSTNADFEAFEAGRSTINSTTFGDVETQRHGIFSSPDKKFSQEYLRKGDGQNVMQIYASIQNPIDLREGINGEDLNAIIEAHGNDGLLTHRDFNYVDPYETWTFFDGDFGERFVAAAKAAGFDGAIMFEAGPDDNKPATTYVAFDANQIKSATGNLGTFNPEDDRVAFSNKKSDLGFYSALSAAIDGINAKAQPADGWKAQIKGLVAKGAIKADEVEWTGINDWLDLQTGKVTKEAVMGYLDANGVQVEEVTLKDPRYDEWIPEDSTEEYGAEEAMPAKYGQYTLPGGDNYREVLLTLPGKKEKWVMRPHSSGKWEVLLDDGSRSLGLFKTEGDAGSELDYVNRTAGESTKGQYKSSHWDQPNVLAHIRVNDRTDASGAKVLFVEELQSDWGQDGKKKGFNDPKAKKQLADLAAQYDALGVERRAAEKEMADLPDFNERFAELQERVEEINNERDKLSAQMDGLRASAKGEAIPTAPFVTKTEGWLNLALKRIITMAVDGGYDKVAFVNGEQSADRYDLSKQVQQVMAKKEGDGFIIFVRDSAGKNHNMGIRSADELPDVVGKELAEKIVAQKKDMDIYEGLDLKVGGEGMKAFYDKIVPNAVNELLRKLKTGAKLGSVDIGRLKGDGDSPYSLGAIDPATANIVERAPGVFQVWAVNSTSGVKQLRGGNFDTRAQAEQYIRDMAPGQTQPGFDVTDAMRERVEEGMPLFANKRQAPVEEQTPPAKTSGLRWRDDTGRLQFAPGDWLWRKSADGWAGTALRLVGMKSMSPELKRQMRQMTHKVEQAKETSAAVARETIKLSQAEREMVSDLVEKTVKAGTMPPAHGVKLAAMINQTMEQQTNKLVALGMLSQEAADRWRGVYLPRYYAPKLKSLTNLDQWGEALKNLMRRPSIMRGIKGKHLKSRGLFENIHPSDLPNYEALGWEVRDPDYQPGVSSEVQVWRDYTPEERENMGEIRDAGFRFIMGYMQTQKDIAMGEMFQNLANDPNISSRLPTETNTVKVPDTKVAETGVKVYGALAGRYVSKETLSHLSSFDEAQSDMLRMYRKGMSLWKEGKTVLNPVAHINNTVSNMTMAHLAGVSYHRGDKYLGAVSDFITGKGYIQEGKENGLFQGNFTEAELAESLPKELRELARMQEGLGVKLGRTAFNIMTMWLRKPMTQAYQFEDSFFKYLIYKDARKRGLDPQDAIDYAQRYIFTYDDLPKNARYIRDFGMPFFAYTYKAIPALLHTAMVHPLRMAMPAGLLWGATAATYAALAGEDDEDWMEKLKRAALDAERRKKIGEMMDYDQAHLPPWMRGETAFLTPKAMRVGFDQTLDMPVFLDVSRFIPGGDLFDINANAGGVPLPQPLTPGHPILGIAMSMIGNRDLFTGKDVVDKNDTSEEAAEKRLAWMWKAVTPAIVFGNYHWDRALDMMANANGGELTYAPEIISERYTGVGRDGLPVQAKYGLPQTFGVKVRPINQDKAEEIELAIDNKRLREIDAEIREINRLNDATIYSDKRAEKMIALQELKKDRLKEGLTVDGDERE